MAESITIIQGESLNLDFHHTESDGTNIDITNIAIRCGARAEHGASSIFIATEPIEITKTIPLEGKWTLLVKDTSSFQKGKYYLEIEYKDSESVVDKPDLIILNIIKGVL